MGVCLVKLGVVLAVVVVTLLGIAGCKRGGETPQPKTGAGVAIQVPTGYQHDPAFDAAGYYMPAAPIQVGNFKLNTISMGAESDFAQWEKGERESLFGPILIQFDDMSSPAVTNEMGGQGREKTLRLLPAGYRLFPGEVSFKSADPALGEVAFTGAFDQAALADAKKVTTSGNASVLHGDLQIGALKFPGVTLTYWAGD